MKEQKKNVLIISNNIECERHVQYISNIEKYFLLNEWDILGDENDIESVNQVVIAACGYHKMMFDRVVNALRSLRKKNCLDDKIIITGCLPNTFEEKLEDEFSGHLIEFKKPELFDDHIQPNIQFREIEALNLFNLWGEKESNRNKMFYIKIADGCVGHCTYCVIKKAKGKLESATIEEVLKQYKRATDNGYRKIFLMGDDTFAYGLDLNSNIVELINALLAYDSDVELYFGSLDIKWLIQYFDAIYDFVKRGVIKKLDFGLQHVRPKVLRMMGRTTEFDKGYEMIKKLKTVAPDLYISGDIIVGFTGETQEDFDHLVDFFKNDTEFDCIKHYGFSQIEGTPAAKLPKDLKVHNLHIAKRWETLKNTLEDRSMYNAVTDPDGQGEAFQRTFNEEIVLCKDSYVEV